MYFIGDGPDASNYDLWFQSRTGVWKDPKPPQESQPMVLAYEQQGQLCFCCFWRDSRKRLPPFFSLPERVCCDQDTATRDAHAGVTASDGDLVAAGVLDGRGEVLLRRPRRAPQLTPLPPPPPTNESHFRYTIDDEDWQWLSTAVATRTQQDIAEFAASEYQKIGLDDPELVRRAHPPPAPCCALASFPATVITSTAGCHAAARRSYGPAPRYTPWIAAAHPLHFFPRPRPPAAARAVPPPPASPTDPSFFFFRAAHRRRRRRSWPSWGARRRRSSWATRASRSSSPRARSSRASPAASTTRAAAAPTAAPPPPPPARRPAAAVAAVRRRRAIAGQRGRRRSTSAS